MPVVTRNRKNGGEAKAEVPAKKVKKATKTSKKTKKSDEVVEEKPEAEKAEDEQPKEVSKDEKKVEEPETVEEKKEEVKEDSKEETEEKADEKDERTAEGMIFHNLWLIGMFQHCTHCLNVIWEFIKDESKKDDEKTFEIVEGGDCPDFTVSFWCSMNHCR